MATYQELLQRQEWKSRRKTIVERDKLICTICHNNSLLKSYQLRTGHRVSNADTKNSCYYVAVRMADKKVRVVKTFLNAENSFWQDGIVRKYVLLYFEKQIDYLKDGEAAVCIAARRMASTEWKNIDNRPIFVNPLARYSQDLIWILNRTLHVHHLYYQVGKMPWEYPDEALTTLCWECHEREHKDNTTPQRDYNGNVIRNLTNCPRCYGAGYLPQYKHVENGICFQCYGARFLELIESPVLAARDF